MTVRMIRARIKADKTAGMEKAAKEWFAAVEAAQPEGVHYAACKLADGETYVILLGLDSDETNPLEAVAGFHEFQETIKDFLAGPPAVEQLTPVGSYRLF